MSTLQFTENEIFILDYIFKEKDGSAKFTALRDIYWIIRIKEYGRHKINTSSILDVDLKMEDYLYTIIQNNKVLIFISKEQLSFWYQNNRHKLDLGDGTIYVNALYTLGSVHEVSKSLYTQLRKCSAFSNKLDIELKTLALLARKLSPMSDSTFSNLNMIMVNDEDIVFWTDAGNVYRMNILIVVNSVFYIQDDDILLIGIHSSDGYDRVAKDSVILSNGEVVYVPDSIKYKRLGKEFKRKLLLRDMKDSLITWGNYAKHSEI